MKTFTLDEANRLLPEIREVLDELLSIRNRLVSEGQTLESVLRHAGGNGGSKKGGEYILLLQRFNATLGMFQELGCELKDLDQGLVDFPSNRDGRIVYLCWKRNEDRISFWHDIDTGFAGRQPL